MTTYLFADRAIVGDGKTVLSPAWIGIEGAKITVVTNRKPEDAQSKTPRSSARDTDPGLMNIHDHISRKSLRFPWQEKPSANKPTR